MDFLISVLEQGMIYGIMALGVYITYKILDFPDLGVDGTFPMGAAVTAALLKVGVNPYLTLIIAFVAGIVAGICTGLIHVKFKVRDLLSGIIMMTGLYTINLYIAGTNNVPLFSCNTIFRNEMTKKLFGNQVPAWMDIVIILVLVLICKILMDLYMKTQSGYLLRAVGDNDVIVTSLAKDKGNVKILGLAISNGLVALSGCVFAQQSKVFDISMGTGALVIGLASVIIGMSFNPYLTLIIAFVAGIVAGICTGLIHVKFKVRDLLSGIIMMTGLYTINLYIAGTNNVPLFSCNTIFRNEMTKKLFGNQVPAWMDIVIILVLVLICKILMDLYMKTQSGYLLRAVGDNDVIVTSLAKDKGNVKILGLAISNGLVALSGCVFAQQSKVFDISMGTGALVIGLASVIIGMSFFKKMSFVKATTAVIIGSIFYKLCVALALKFAGATATKLVTAILFLVILVVSVDRKKKVKVNA